MRTKLKRTSTIKLPVEGKKPTALENELVFTLSLHCGQRGDNEGALECLERIIRERDLAMSKLALLAMHEKFQFFFK